MTNFTNLEEEIQYYRNKYDVETLSEETIKQIFKDENLSDAFIISAGGGIWDDISHFTPLTIEFIKKYENKINFNTLSHNEYIELETIEYVIRNYIKHIDFNYLLANPNISDALINKFIGNVSSYEYILLHQTLSEDIISKYFDLFVKKDAYYLYRYQTIPFSFLKNNKEKIDWKLFSKNAKLTKEQMITFKNKIDWNLVEPSDDKEAIPLEILDEYINFFNLDNLVKVQQLEEWFIEKHYESFDSNYLWETQLFSEEFIRKNAFKFDWNVAEFQPNLPMDMIENNVEKTSYRLIKSRQFSEKALKEMLLSNHLVHFLTEYQDFSVEFYKQFSKKLDQYDLNRNLNLNQNVKNLYNQKMKIKNMLNKNK
jgi:hypothetical protein